jgi:hypothetical protein
LRTCLFVLRRYFSLLDDPAFQTKKIIEIGLGYSSCVMLDTNELFFGNGIDITFVEPYPELLLTLIKKTDRWLDKGYVDAIVEKKLIGMQHDAGPSRSQ